METETIAAISTPIGEGGIAVIRVSGSEAVQIVDKVFKGRLSLHKVESHTVHYGHIVHPTTGERIDEVLVTVMRKPRTFTREDVRRGKLSWWGCSGAIHLGGYFTGRSKNCGTW